MRSACINKDWFIHSVYHIPRPKYEKTSPTFGLEYENNIVYEYNSSNLVHVPKIITCNTNLLISKRKARALGKWLVWTLKDALVLNLVIVLKFPIFTSRDLIHLQMCPKPKKVLVDIYIKKKWHLSDRSSRWNVFSKGPSGLRYSDLLNTDNKLYVFLFLFF